MDGPTADGLIQLAEAARASRRGQGEASDRAALDARYDEAMAALDWLRDEGRGADAFRLATALVPFWIATQRIEDGDRWFAATLGDGAGAPARALYDHGYLVFWTGQYELAEERFVAARTAAAVEGDATVQGLALAGSARVALDHDVERAIELLREALRVTEGTDDVAARSSAMHVLGVALQMSGDLEGARDIMQQRIEVGRTAGDPFTVWVESANLSMVERKLGNLEQAAALSREALSIVAAQGDEMAIPWVMNGLAAVLAARGDHEQAATVLGRAEAMLEQAGGAWPPDEREQYEATVETLMAAMGQAALERARATGAAMSMEDGVAYALAIDAGGASG